MKIDFKFILLLTIIMALSLSSVSAADLETIQSGEVSGGVDIASSNPGVENGELTYEIPDTVENVDYAGLFIDCYTAGSDNLVYGSDANITLSSNGASEEIANERLVADVGSPDGTVYEINDHTTKCFADYMMTYNLTDKLQNLRGNITIKVNTSKIEGYQYYNKIKMIGLVFAYDDGDEDKFDYWVNAGSSWIKTDSGETSKAKFNLGIITEEFTNATIDNFALSSADGIYKFNDEELNESLLYEEGVYYFIHHKFDIIDRFKNRTNTLVYSPSEGSYSFRNVLSVLTLSKVLPVSARVNLTYECENTVFAGTENLLRINLVNNGSNPSVYNLDLYADGVKVNGFIGLVKDGEEAQENCSKVSLNPGEDARFYIVDDTIRPLTENTVNGINNVKVNYTAVLSKANGGDIVLESTFLPVLLYNGNLGKDLAYPSQNISLFDAITVNGDIIIDTLDESTYLGTKTTGRSDVWTLDIPDGGELVNGFIYIPYSGDRSNSDAPIWNASFNGEKISPVASYKDQSNIGASANSSWGLVVYDVSDLIKSGENSLVLKKENGSAAIFPSTLLALYNKTDSSTLKTIYRYHGADLLSREYNALGRTVASNGILEIDSYDNLIGAKLHVFAAGAQSGEGNLIVNNQSFEDIWNGSMTSVSEYIVDLGISPKKSNDLSFIATSSSVMALQDFIVLEYNVPSAKVNLSSEYDGVAFAGTNNVLKLNLTNDGSIDGNYLLDFYVDGEKVNSSSVALKSDESIERFLIDETIRPVTQDTVIGQNNRIVNYTVIVSDEGTGILLDEVTITPLLLYNGNLGKDLAYPAENISLFDTVTVNGGVIIDTMDDSTYLASKTTNRTDVWTLDIGDDAKFVNGFLYVPYNWDKTDGTMPVWNATFNGVTIVPLASYRDQSNMGNYGKYGYGLVVYDISDLIKSGENVFVLEKENGTTAVYPSTLIGLYNKTDSNTFTSVYIFNGADLLSNSNNFLNRTVASNNILNIGTFKDVISADLYVFAASAQKGEGNLIIGNESYSDIWNGTSNSVDSYIVDLGSNPAESIDLSFVSTGSTILALEDIAVVKYYVPSAKVDLISEYNGVAFAGTNNVLKVNLTNDGIDSSVYEIEFYVDGEKIDSAVLALESGVSSEFFFVDDEIRAVSSDTVIGENNKIINYAVVVLDKNNGMFLDESTVSAALLYNGNLGKDLAYPAENISLFDAISVNGGVIIDTMDDSTYLGSKTTNRTDVWTIDIGDGEFVDGFVYVPYNWDKSDGAVPIWNASFNGVSISPVASYRDQSNMGTYGKYGYGLIVYDVSQLLLSGENSFKLEKENGTTAVYPSTLVALYNLTGSNTFTTVYMYNGADLLSNANNFLNRTVSSNNLLDIELPNHIVRSELLIFAASAQDGESDLIVDDKTYSNVWNGTSNSVDKFIVDLEDNNLSFIKESNNVSFIATGSTILALQEFIILEYNIPSVKANLISEYDGVAFAGTNNALKLNLSNEAEINLDYIVDFYVDGTKANSSQISLNAGESGELLLLDDAIRPVTANTVNGADNDKVNYTVIITDKASGEILDEITILPSVLYNGNLGKDLAYPGENISLFDAITVNGGVIIDTMDDSTYLGSKTTNRTDVWTISVPDSADFVKGFVYVPYNWDKTDGAIPLWNASFNGVVVNPIASYRDQSNLGTYGRYGYGLVVYDVSDIILSGENSFELEKENGTTAVYPSTLVAFYNQTESDLLTTVYIYNWADLLSNANNFLNRTVSSNNVLNIGNLANSLGNITGAKLYVFAAGAQSGEGNLIVNDKLYENVWNGTSNSVNAYIIDLEDSIKESNAVSFVATGSTILALEQFLIVESPAPLPPEPPEPPEPIVPSKSSADLQKIIDDAKPGSTIDLGNETFENVSDVNIAKNLTITGGHIIGKEGEAIFVIPPKSAGGPNEVNITGVDFKVNNGNIIVKASADNDTKPAFIDVSAINIYNNSIELADENVVPESVTVLELDSERNSLAPTSPISVQGNNIPIGADPFEFKVISVISEGGDVIIDKGGLLERKISQIQYNDMNTTAINQKIEGRAGKYFEVNLTDIDGKALADKKIQIGFNGAVYNRTTNATGGARLQINLGYKGTYTFAISFLGDDEYNGSFAVAKIVVSTQKTKLSASKKTYKASAKTKTLSATLKDANGKAISGKKISFTVNGKTYSGKTNAKGVASVKVSLSSKKTYSFTVKYAGDNMYAGSSVKSKITIK